jgi:multiple sugar transport system permease protein
LEVLSVAQTVNLERQTQDPAPPESGFEAPVSVGQAQTLLAGIDRHAGKVFLWPAVLSILVLSIFPFIASLYLSLARFKFVKGGFELNFVGLANYQKLVVGSQKTQFLGSLKTPDPLGWVVFGLIGVALALFLVQYIRGSKFSISGLFWRGVMVAGMLLFAWLVVQTLFSEGGSPGTVVVTLIFVFGGTIVQYVLGLSLALAASQKLPGQRFFRVLFIVPMMISPVAFAYMFRMLTDPKIGPFKPLWRILGLTDYAWSVDPWGARVAIIIGDTWQWVALIFIFLLAALKSQPVQLLEAAVVDGANRWQIFWHITMPQLLPLSTTLILIRLIESFKIVDLPLVLTGGGPGVATKSLSLQVVVNWRALNLGEAAAVAYMLVIITTFFALCFIVFVRNRAVEKLS